MAKRLRDLGDPKDLALVLAFAAIGLFTGITAGLDVLQGRKPWGWAFLAVPSLLVGIACAGGLLFLVWTFLTHPPLEEMPDPGTMAEHRREAYAAAGLHVPAEADLWREVPAAVLREEKSRLSGRLEPPVYFRLQELARGWSRAEEREKREVGLWVLNTASMQELVPLLDAAREEGEDPAQTFLDRRMTLRSVRLELLRATGNPDAAEIWDAATPEVLALEDERLPLELRAVREDALALRETGEPKKEWTAHWLLESVPLTAYGKTMADVWDRPPGSPADGESADPAGNADPAGPTPTADPAGVETILRGMFWGAVGDPAYAIDDMWHDYLTLRRKALRAAAGADPARGAAARWILDEMTFAWYLHACHMLERPLVDGIFEQVAAELRIAPPA